MIIMKYLIYAYFIPYTYILGIRIWAKNKKIPKYAISGTRSAEDEDLNLVKSQPFLYRYNTLFVSL
jgi:hypothetical protein